MPTEPPEILYVTERVVACDGGGALGHPRVFINMGDDNRAECGYCDRLFLLKGKATEEAGR
jgi:uncharacterized Zn-finger protein